MEADLNAEETRYRSIASLRVDAPGSVETLLDALHDTGWRVRKAAVDRIRRIKDPVPVIPRLVGILGQKGQTGARNAAVDALVLLGQWSVGPVQSLLTHEDPDRRKFAADILGSIGDAAAVSALAAAVNDSDANVRLSAVEALGRLGGEQALSAVESALHSEDPVLRLACLEALIALRRPAPFAVLAPLLEDPVLMRSAYRVLGLIPELGATARVCEGLAHPRKSIREAALAALGLQRSVLAEAHWQEQGRLIVKAFAPLAEGEALLVQALGAEDADVRAGALLVVGLTRPSGLAVAVAQAAKDEVLVREVTRTLEQLGPDGAAELLTQLEHLSASAKLAAADALEALSHPGLVPGLEKLLKQEEAELQWAALRALGASKAASAIPVLVRRLSSSSLGGVAARALVTLAKTEPRAVAAALDEEVLREPSAAALFALAQVAGASAVGALRECLKHPLDVVRAMAVQAVCEAGGAEALDLLSIALNDESSTVRVAAVKGCGALRAPPDRLVSLLRRALSDSDPEVELAAIAAVGESQVRVLADQLEPYLRGKDGRRAVRALKSLSQLGGLTTPLLQVAAHHEDPEVAKDAVLAGAHFAGGLDVALELIRHGQWDVRAVAARVLGTNGGREYLQPVKEALALEVDPLTRDALTEAARQLSQREP